MPITTGTKVTNRAASFQVTSKVDSRTILGEQGADAGVAVAQRVHAAMLMCHERELEARAR